MRIWSSDQSRSGGMRPRRGFDRPDILDHAAPERADAQKVQLLGHPAPKFAIATELYHGLCAVTSHCKPEYRVGA